MTLKIGIITDSIEIGPTSIGNYTRNLVKELLEIKDDNVEIILIHGQESDNPIYKKAEEVIIPFPKAKKHKYFVVKLFYFLFRQCQDSYRNYKIKKVCEKNKVDVLHIPHLGRPAPSIIFINTKFKLVVTNNGMANLALPRKLCWGNASPVIIWYHQLEYLKWKVLRNKLSSIISVSEYGKEELVTKAKMPCGKIKPIYHGVDNRNFKVLQDKENIFQELKNKYGIKNDFLLHISSYQPKKNVSKIIKSFAMVKEKHEIKHKLVIIGDHPDSLRSLAKSLSLDDEIIFLGFINHKELPYFLNIAIAFIFPSLHESFGMPITEAMACGCPVITSNVTACPEVAGDAALLVNPYSTEEIAEAINKILSDGKLREELKQKGLKRAKGFTWENCAKEHLKVYKEVQ